MTLMAGDEATGERKEGDASFRGPGGWLRERRQNIMTTLSPAMRRLVVAALLGLSAQLIVWLPFATRPDVVARHFDGPNYLVVAKTLYRPTAVNPMPGYIGSPSYFAVHLPAYPLAVRALVPLAGWPNALLLATALFGMASAMAFVLWISDEAPGAPWLPLLLVFLLLPPRSFLYRALGATEAPMAFFVLLALWARGREKTGLAVAAAGLASICRINGVLLVGLLALELLYRRRPLSAVAAGAAGLAPLALVFAWQSAVLGRGAAFLDAHRSKPSFQPFQGLQDLLARNEWVAGDLVVWALLFHVLAAALLLRRGYRFEAALVAAHVALLSFVRETDLSRYFLTVAPLAFVLAWEDVLRDRRIAWAVLAFALAIGLPYAWGSVPMNLCEPGVYQHLLEFLEKPLLLAAP
jgi:hypothetical protein